MVVASFYTEHKSRDPAVSPFCERETVRSFILSVAPLVEDYYIFSPNGVNLRELFSDCPPECACCTYRRWKSSESSFKARIDIWHDFGSGNWRTCDQIGRLTRQKFHTTCDFKIGRLSHYGDTGHADWSAYDGVIYPTEYAREVHRRSTVASLPAVWDVIPPSVNSDLVATVTKEDARRLLGFSQDEVLFLSASDLSARCGTDLLPVVTAFELAASGQMTFRLVVSGRRLSDVSSKLRDGVLSASILGQVTVLTNPHPQIFLCCLLPPMFLFTSLIRQLSNRSSTLVYAMAGTDWPSLAHDGLHVKPSWVHFDQIFFCRFIPVRAFSSILAKPCDASQMKYAP